MKVLGIICVSLLVLAFAVPAFAETQNVTVSGDIAVYGGYRDQFDLNKNDNDADSDNFIMSIVELQIDADLTDNVSTVIRLVNQRNWGDEGNPGMYDSGTGWQDWYQNRLLNIGLDLAYVKIKEMIFEPVTLTIGRQDLWFGRGFVVGASQRHPGFIPTAYHGYIFGWPAQPIGQDQFAIGAPEATAYNSFDAIRATIDFEQYAPFVVDLVYAKLYEGFIGPEEDANLIGVNAGYTFDVYNAEAEAYYWLKHDNSYPVAAAVPDTDTINLIGTRGSFQPDSDWVFAGEVAYQFGNYIDPNDTNALGTINVQTDDRNRDAWAANLAAEYLGWMDYAWSPKVGAEYLFYSGDDGLDEGLDRSGRYEGWDPFFGYHYPMAIRPWIGTYYRTDLHPDGADSGLTNQHQIILSGIIQPLDDLSFEAKGAYYWFDQAVDTRMYGTGNRNGSETGSEINLITTYDYTEDVTFSLLSGWFFPGQHYEGSPDRAPGGVNETADVSEQVATEIVGSMKVSF